MAYIPEGYTIDPKVTEEVGKAVGGAVSGAHSGGNRIFAGIASALTRNYIITYLKQAQANGQMGTM